MRLRLTAKSAGPGCISCLVSSRRVGEQSACRLLCFMEQMSDREIIGLYVLFALCAGVWVLAFGWQTVAFFFFLFFLLSRFR